jgi:biopolymer transport protein ExbD
MRLKRTATKKWEVNMVPMIDCVFQLIIFFLVSTQVKKTETTDVTLPQARMPEDVNKDEIPLIVNILKPQYGKERPYFVMGNYFNLRELKAFLKTRKESLKIAGGEMPVLRIRADRDSQFKEIQEALIACRDIGIWQVRLSAIKTSAR